MTDNACGMAKAAGSERSHLVQVVVALIGLIGVLGAALFANWDKLFPVQQQAPMPEAAVRIDGSAAPPSVAPLAAAALAGRWLTPELQSPYASNTKYRLQFDFELLGDDLHGTVTTLLVEPVERRSTQPIIDGRVSGDGVAFVTRSTLTSSDAPVTERYRGAVGRDGAIEFSRFNDVPTGGAVEKFSARRP